MMTDPVADMLTRIRNANAIERAVVDIPASKLKANIAAVLRDEGFIDHFEIGRVEPDDHGFPTFTPDGDLSKAKVVLRVYLKYSPDGEKVIRNIDRASRPGRRLYRHANKLPKVLDGLGIAVVSTSQGVMSDRKARREGLGGEILCTVW